MRSLGAGLLIILSSNVAFSKTSVFKTESGISFEVPRCYSVSQSPPFVNFTATDRCVVKNSDFSFRESESAGSAEKATYLLQAGARGSPECFKRAKAVQARGGALECGAEPYGTQHKLFVNCGKHVGVLIYSNDEAFKEQKVVSDLQPKEVRAVFESVRCNGKPIQLPTQKWSRGLAE